MSDRQQLVEQIFDRKADSALLARMQPVIANLDRHRFTSTDEFAVNRRWEGLCEKFSIKGHHELAARLRSRKAEFMDNALSIADSCTSISSQLALKYDMLALLLALSSGTPAASHAISTAECADQESGAEFWRRTVEEEPLEGDHWQQPEDDDDDMASMDGTDDEFELDEEELARFKTRSVAEDEPMRPISPTDGRWHSVYEPIIQHEEEETAQNLDHAPRYWEDPSGLTEANIAREVLFMLRGLPSIFYDRIPAPSDRMGYFHLQVVPTLFPLGHVSNTAVKGILSEFCSCGNMLADLRAWTQRVVSECQTGAQRHGQTCEAFAICVTEALQTFEKRISDIEVNHCQTQDGQSIISLLNLKNTLDPSLKAFQAIHEIAVQVLASDVSRTTTQLLLSILYARICDAELQGRKDIYNVLLYMYHQTIKPFGKLLDDWTQRATLKSDVAEEFFISRSNRRESEFIEDEFHVHIPHEDHGVPGCPLFSAVFIDKIFFVGKAIEIISRFNDEMEPVPIFDYCLKHAIPIPKTVFNATNNDDTLPVRQSSYSPLKPRAFLQAGFPLLYSNQHQARPTATNHDISLSADPYLFDQAVMQSLDHYIAEPYIQATHKLRQVLYESCDLEVHLRRIASIYLMLEDDLMHVFCEALFQEMDKGIYAANSTTNTQIDKLFMDAKSATGGFHLELTTSGCFFDHTADGSFLDKIRFTYHLPWPINNYIRRSSLRKYGLITALLLRLKRTKHLLDRKTLTQQKRSMRLHAMRVRLIWFVNAFSGYVMTTVLHTETMALRVAIEKLVNMDDMVELHADYVARIVDRCLLGETTRLEYAAALRILDQVQDLAQMFIQVDAEASVQFDETLDDMTRNFIRDSEFITTSLANVARKGGALSFDTLAASLSTSPNDIS